ncbi:MAG: efflux transporter outer membrane subunit [Smithella sp.]|jgi:NodT family efflux transporter outer membrane factor (OMF) lipoprotein
MKSFSRRIPFIVIITVVTLAGCAAGPDFRSPDMATPDHYTAALLPAQTASAPSESGAAQHFIFAKDLPGEWWTLFRSPELDKMIKQGLTDNPTLVAAQAALRKSEEDLRTVSGSILYPAVNANLQAGRQRISGNAELGPSDTYNLYNASVGVSYTLDLFGGGRRQIEAYQAQIDYQSYIYEATYLTLAANIVTVAIQEASLREQIDVTKAILVAEKRQLDVIQKQFELGAVSKTEVLAQETELAMTKAGMPPLEKQLDLNRHALSVLIGQFPGDGKLPEFNLESLHLPEELPVSLPSLLARQRPDVRASEALLHQACAAVGVATANLYPQITLSAGYGFQAVSTDILFNGESVVWNFGAGLLQPLFRGGELTAKRRSAIAAYDQAAAQYRQTVLKAFQDVADVLRALETDARTLQAQAEAEAASKSALALIEKQYELGAVSYPALLIAQRDYQKTRINVVAAQAQRYADTAALFQALGGSWWNRKSTSLNAKFIQEENKE